MSAMNRQDRNMIGNRAIPREYLAENGGPSTGGMKDVAQTYIDRYHKMHDRLMREATGGLCGFDVSGELVMAVDPAKAKGGRR